MSGIRGAGSREAWEPLSRPRPTQNFSGGDADKISNQSQSSNSVSQWKQLQKYQLFQHVQQMRQHQPQQQSQQQPQQQSQQQRRQHLMRQEHIVQHAPVQHQRSEPLLLQQQQQRQHDVQQVSQQQEPQEIKKKRISRRRKLTPSVSLLQTLNKRRSASCHSPRDYSGRDLSDGDFLGDENAILQGPVDLTTGVQTQSRYIFLYPDSLVLTKQKSTSSYRLKLRVKIGDVWVATCCDVVSEVLRHPERSFVIGWPTINMVASFVNQETKEKWFQTLSECISAFKSKDLHPYISVKVVNRDKSYCISKTIKVGNKEQAVAATKRCVEEFHIQNSSPDDYQLWVIPDNKTEAPYPLIGHEFPYAIRMKYIRDHQVFDRSRSTSNLHEPESPSVVNMETFDPSKGITFQILRRDQNKQNLARKLSWEDADKASKKLSPIARILKITSRITMDQQKLFGRDLSELWKNGVFCTPIMNMLHHLYKLGPSTSGIFRKSASYAKCREAKARLDAGRDLNFDSIPVLTTASLLKELLRCLPNCLLTCGLYDEWINVTAIQESKERNTHIQNLLQKLPLCNRKLLLYIVSLLLRISEESKENQMTTYNLSVCFSHCLLWPEVKNSTPGVAGPVGRLEDAYKLNLLVLHILDGADEIFGPECKQMFEIGGRRGVKEEGDLGTRLSLQSRNDSESSGSGNIGAEDSLLSEHGREFYDVSDADSNHGTHSRLPTSQISASYDSGLTASNSQLYEDSAVIVNASVDASDLSSKQTSSYTAFKSASYTKASSSTQGTVYDKRSSIKKNNAESSSSSSRASSEAKNIEQKADVKVLNMLSFSAPNTPHHMTDLLSESDRATVSRFFGSDDASIFKDDDKDDLNNSAMIFSSPTDSEQSQAVQHYHDVEESPSDVQSTSSNINSSSYSGRSQSYCGVFERRQHTVSCPSMYDASINDLTITDDTFAFDMSDQMKESSESVFDDSYVDDWTRSDLDLVHAEYQSQDDITSKSLFNLPSALDDSASAGGEEGPVRLRQRKSRVESHHERRSCFEPVVQRRSTVLEKTGMTNSGADLFPAELRKKCLSGDFTNAIEHVTIVNVTGDSDASPKVSPIKRSHSKSVPEHIQTSALFLPAFHDSVVSLEQSFESYSSPTPRGKTLVYQPALNRISDMVGSASANVARPARPPPYEEALIHRAVKQENKDALERMDTKLKADLTGSRNSRLSRRDDKIKNVDFSVSDKKPEEKLNKVYNSSGAMPVDYPVNNVDKQKYSKPSLPSYEQACMRIRSQENLLQESGKSLSKTIVQNANTGYDGHCNIINIHINSGDKKLRLDDNRSKSSYEIPKLPSAENIYARPTSQVSSFVIISSDNADLTLSNKVIVSSENKDFNLASLKSNQTENNVPKMDRSGSSYPLASLTRSKSDTSDVILRLINGDSERSKSNEENIAGTLSVYVQRRNSDCTEKSPKRNQKNGTVDDASKKREVQNFVASKSEKTDKRKPLTVKDHGWHQQLVEQYSNPTVPHNSPVVSLPAGATKNYQFNSTAGATKYNYHQSPVLQRPSQQALQSRYAMRSSTLPDISRTLFSNISPTATTTGNLHYTSPVTSVSFSPSKYETEAKFKTLVNISSPEVKGSKTASGVVSIDKNTRGNRSNADYSLASNTFSCSTPLDRNNELSGGVSLQRRSTDTRGRTFPLRGSDTRGGSFQQRGTDAHGYNRVPVCRHQSDVFQYVRPQQSNNVALNHQSALRYKKNSSNTSSYGRELDPRHVAMINSRTNASIKPSNEDYPKNDRVCDRSKIVYDYCGQNSPPDLHYSEHDDTLKAARSYREESDSSILTRGLQYSRSLYADGGIRSSIQSNPEYQRDFQGSNRSTRRNEYIPHSNLRYNNSDANYGQNSPNRSSQNSFTNSRSVPSLLDPEMSFNNRGADLAGSMGTLNRDYLPYYSQTINENVKKFDSKYVHLQNANA